MDDGPEQGGQDDYEPDVTAPAAPAAKQKAAKEYFLACCPSALRAMSRRAVRYRGSQGLLRGLMSSADALTKAVRVGESQRPLPGQAIGVQDNSPRQRASFMGCFQVRSRERFPVGQNVGKRDSAVRAALGLFEKADCDRLGNRVARGCFAGVQSRGRALRG